MRKLLLISVVLFAPLAFSQAGALSGYCMNGGQTVGVSGLQSITTVQQSIPSCTVTVYLTGTLTPATLYSDGSNTPLGNPFTARTDAFWSFYAAAGIGYDIVMSGGTAPNTYPSPFTLPNVVIPVPFGGGGSTYKVVNNIVFCAQPPQGVPATCLAAAQSLGKFVIFPSGRYSISASLIAYSGLTVQCAQADPLGANGTVFALQGGVADWILSNPNADAVSGPASNNEVLSMSWFGCGFDISGDSAALGGIRVKGILYSNFYADQVISDVTNVNPGMTEDGSNFLNNGGDYDNVFSPLRFYNKTTGGTNIGIYVTGDPITGAGSNSNYHVNGTLTRYGTGMLIDGGNQNVVANIDTENSHVYGVHGTTNGAAVASGNVIANNRYEASTTAVQWESGTYDNMVQSPYISGGTNTVVDNSGQNSMIDGWAGSLTAGYRAWIVNNKNTEPPMIMSVGGVPNMPGGNRTNGGLFATPLVSFQGKVYFRDVAGDDNGGNFQADAFGVCYHDNGGLCLFGSTNHPNSYAYLNSFTGNPVRINFGGTGPGLDIFDNGLRQFRFNANGQSWCHADPNCANTLLMAMPTPSVSRTTTFADAAGEFTLNSSTQTFTNKTFDTAGTGNVLKINGTQISSVTGTGSAVLNAAPAITTMTLSASGSTITTNGTLVGAGTCQAQPTATITGAATTSVVMWNLPNAPVATWQTGITVMPTVTSANTVVLYLCNPTAGSITPAAQVVNLRVIQ